MTLLAYLSHLALLMSQESAKGRLGGLPSTNSGTSTGGGGGVGTGFRRVTTGSSTGSTVAEDAGYKIPENVLR